MVPIPRKFVHGVAAPVCTTRHDNLDASTRRVTLPPPANNARITSSRKTLPTTGLALLKAVLEADGPEERVESNVSKTPKTLGGRLASDQAIHGDNGAHDPPSSPVVSSNGPKPLPALPTSWTCEFEVVPEMSVIGVGAYGTVFQVRHKASQQLFACKVIERNFLEVRGMAAQLDAEINFLQCSSLSCRVARLLGTAEESGLVFLLLELCPRGTLDHELCAQPAGHLDEARAARCARHMLQALMDVHSMGILHRDIKLDNLLVAADSSVKLADFGWAASAQSNPSGLAGTFFTMAPEVLREEVHTTAVDMWSAGAVIFQLVTGRPFLIANIGAGATQLSASDLNAATRARQQILLDEISQACPLRPSARPSHVSPACWDLLGKLLEPSAAKRWTAKEALQHEWLQAPEVAVDLSQTESTISPTSSCRSSSSASVDDASQLVVTKQVLPEVIAQVVDRKSPRLVQEVQVVERQVAIPQVQKVEKMTSAPRIKAFAEIVSVPLLEQVRNNFKTVGVGRAKFFEDLGKPSPAVMTESAR